MSDNKETTREELVLLLKSARETMCADVQWELTEHLADALIRELEQAPAVEAVDEERYSAALTGLNRLMGYLRDCIELVGHLVQERDEARAALARASEAAGEPIGWFQLKPEFGSDRIGIRWNGDGRLNDGQALYAATQPAQAAVAPVMWEQVVDGEPNDTTTKDRNHADVWELNGIDVRALYAAPQPASEQQATHVSVPRELFQDLVEEVSDYAASRKFRKSEIEWRKERIEAAWAILAAKGDGHV